MTQSETASRYADLHSRSVEEIKQAPTGGPVHTYNNGQPYTVARGRDASRAQIEFRGPQAHSVVNGFPTVAGFVRAIERELKIRCYRPATRKNYINAIKGFLRWFGNLPHRVRREDVRAFLETLVDGGLSSSQVSIHLAAIRNSFDKMCGRDITLGLATPRKPKRIPIVPSEKEIIRILCAAPTFRDKLLIGMMYATGLRVSEVVSLRWRDLDFDRNVVQVRDGKGASDRQVMLPDSFQPVLRHYHQTDSQHSVHTKQSSMSV